MFIGRPLWLHPESQIAGVRDCGKVQYSPARRVVFLAHWRAPPRRMCQGEQPGGVVRKFHQYRDEARELTTGLCVLLAIAVVGTILVSALALAGVAVFGSYAYLSATTSIKMPLAHWYQMYLHRLGDAGILTTLLV